MKKSELTERFLASAEEALRDISSAVEHCGTTDAMIKSIHASLQNYWHRKSETMRPINRAAKRGKR